MIEKRGKVKDNDEKGTKQLKCRRKAEYKREKR